MPELPDVTVYCEALAKRVSGTRLTAVRLVSPFLLRTVEPPLEAMAGRTVTGVRRLGKRVVLELEPDRFLVIHLMIAGRLRWGAPGAKLPGRIGLAAFDFSGGTLLLTEAGSKRRAGLWAVRGEAELAAHDPGGIEPLAMSLTEFTAALRRERHTLKRSLTDPRLISGIGNAYSDEILHAAGLSPLQLSTNLDDSETHRLWEAVRLLLTAWTDRLRAETGEGFPGKVTAFRDGMAVHGRYRQPCPVCGDPVQRIRYAANEVNYCATCQTGGRLLADRALSRLLREDWPGSLDELEEKIASARLGEGGHDET